MYCLFMLTSLRIPAPCVFLFLAIRSCYVLTHVSSSFVNIEILLNTFVNLYPGFLYVPILSHHEHHYPGCLGQADFVSGLVFFFCFFLIAPFTSNNRFNNQKKKRKPLLLIEFFQNKSLCLSSL